MIYYYYEKDRKFAWEYRPPDSKKDMTRYGLDTLCTVLAEDLFHNHDGWEASWPMTIYIWFDDEYMGAYSVDMETVPVFHGTRVND